MTELVRLEAVFIESSPFSGPAEPVLDSLYATLPQPFLDALFELHGNVDRSWCAQCDCLTGYVVACGHVTDHVEWLPTALVREVDGPIAVLCGDCAPYVPDSLPSPDASEGDAA